MTTINTVITNARYDLRDISISQFEDAELRVYANRALRQLDNVLSSHASDWTLNEGSLTLSTSDNYVAGPTSCIFINSVWITTTQLTKRSPQQIYDKQKYITSSQQPMYWAHSSGNILFECVPNSAYAAKVYYHKRSAELIDGSSMPYSDEFNDPLQEMIILLAHKRNENEPVSDSEIYNFLMDRCLSNAMYRVHTDRVKLDF